MHKLLDWIKNMGGVFNHISLFNVSFFKGVKESIQMILQNCTGDNLIDYKIYGKSTQGENPSSTNPQEIKSVGDLITDNEDPNFGKYKIPVKISGKNKFKLYANTGEETRDGVKFSFNSFNEIILNGTANNGTWTEIIFDFIKGTDTSSKIQIPLNAQKSYTLKSKILSGSYSCSIEPTFNIQISLSNLSKAIELNDKSVVFSGSDGVYRGWFRTHSGDVFNNLKIGFQLVESSTEIPYESYHEPITVPIYLNAPLRKIGDIEDYIDFENKKVIRNIGEIIIDGSENWHTIESKNVGETFYAATSRLDKLFKNTNLMCNNFSKLTSLWESDVEGIQIYNLDYSLRFRILKAGLEEETIDSFKNWLSTHNTEVIYVSATPIEENIELPEIPTFEGTTIIEVETETQPSNMWVKYYSN